MAGEQYDGHSGLLLAEPDEDFITRLETDMREQYWTLHSVYTYQAEAVTEPAAEPVETIEPEALSADKPDKIQSRVVDPIKYLDKLGELTFRGLQEEYGPTNVKMHKSENEQEVALVVNSSCLQTSPTEIAS